MNTYTIQFMDESFYVKIFFFKEDLKYQILNTFFGFFKKKTLILYNGFSKYYDKYDLELLFH